MFEKIFNENLEKIFNETVYQWVMLNRPGVAGAVLQALTD